MSVVPLAVVLRREQVLRFLGYPEEKQPGQSIDVLLDEVIEEARAAVSPRGVFRSHPVERSKQLLLEPIEATALVVGLVTIGGAVEQRARQLVAAGDATRALLMDAAGSAAVEETADRLGAVIAADDAPASGHFGVSCRISPGYGAWPIHAQERLFAALPHAELGVSLMPSLLMSPEKSISFAMWLGADRRPLAGLSGCARCELIACRYRRSSRKDTE
jgi:hypothetical protein